ncbi:ACP S-malonyltransferase [Streptomyces sp. DSM 44915]|uniref:[acyl-carrier-protein] S-malonyltransferase n=1 Tax=Streptomyces chisholmiae TaxID=3075540 RepID=A0ABU2JW81_9ACTN|nr:ACP S-malonyltransferase [Streptomyces sp. DSM 44915]MDT0269261.1 ACP S-malonyltransferase [Streptomyces sp. DSM 44915]
MTDNGEDPLAAVVFPGMGPTRYQDVAEFMAHDPVARRLVAVADEALGYSLRERYQETEGDYSPVAQVAFMVNCVAFAEWAEERMDARPALCVGPSFGAKAAAAYSGALDLADAVRLTERLALLMEDYFRTAHQDLVTLSFVRLPAERLAELQGEIDALGEWHDLACTLDEDFFMLTVAERRVEWLSTRLRSLGAMPLYTMRPPMHSEVFAPLRARAAAEVVDGLTFHPPRLPLVSDHDGGLVDTADGVRTLLLDGFVRRLHWPTVVSALRAAEVRRLWVAGQDSLFGRVPATLRNFTVTPVNARLVKKATAPT